jgi:hypothetical protein
VPTPRRWSRRLLPTSRRWGIRRDMRGLVQVGIAYQSHTHVWRGMDSGPRIRCGEVDRSNESF